MRVANEFAKMSYATRLQVGCVVVKKRNIISHGYNGTPPGEDNACEDEHGCTKPDVSHAEENALMKLCASSMSSRGATVFITHSPCINCAKLLANAKIKTVYFLQHYRSTEGVSYLRRRKIEVIKIDLEGNKIDD